MNHLALFFTSIRFHHVDKMVGSFNISEIKNASPVKSEKGIRHQENFLFRQAPSLGKL